MQYLNKGILLFRFKGDFETQVLTSSVETFGVQQGVPRLKRENLKPLIEF